MTHHLVIILFTCLTAFGAFADPWRVDELENQHVVLSTAEGPVKYHLYDTLGSGGFAVVYAGESDSDKAAIKVLTNASPSEAFKNANRVLQIINRYQSELERRQIARLPLLRVSPLEMIKVGLDSNQRELTSFYGLRSELGMPFSLDDLHDIVTFIPEDSATAREAKRTAIYNITLSIIKAFSLLHGAHDYGMPNEVLTHGDIKPQNVLFRFQPGYDKSIIELYDGLVTGKVEPVLGDFDLTDAVSLEKRLADTPEAKLYGTLAYLAPDYIFGESRNKQPSDDWFSLGVIVYSLVTGRHPCRQTIPSFYQNSEKDWIGACWRKHDEEFELSHKQMMDFFDDVIRDEVVDQEQTQFLRNLVDGALRLERRMEHIAARTDLTLRRGTYLHTDRDYKFLESSTISLANLQLHCEHLHSTTLPHQHPQASILSMQNKRTVILYEQWFASLKAAPIATLRSLFMLLHGRARFKAALVDLQPVEPKTLSYNQVVLELLHEAKKSGRRLVLATASHATTANRIADHLGIFDEVHGTTSSLNLKGPAKAEMLSQRFGHKGFDYIGDSRSDLAVWNVAHGAVVVGKSQRFVESIRRKVNVIAAVCQQQTTLSYVIRALRPHQWSKNVLIFLPLLLAHPRSFVDPLITSCLAFLSFCSCASAIYLVNDLTDLSSDRLHPKKRLRPFASGDLPLAFAFILIPSLLIIGLGLASLLHPTFLVTIVAYLILTTLYSFRLKQVLCIDVIVLASLYTVRLFAGGLSTGLTVSHWLLTMSMFVFLGLAIMKRVIELGGKCSLENIQAHAKPLPGRPYSGTDLPVLMMLGAAAGYVAVLVFALYLNSNTVMNHYTEPKLLWLICPLFLYWVTRSWLLTNQGLMHHDPITFVLRDRASYLLLMIVFAIAVLAWHGLPESLTLTKTPLLKMPTFAHQE